MIIAVLPVAVLSAPQAAADCTGAGDFGAAAGCAPPGNGSGSSVPSWPPTAVDWPPQLDSTAGNDATDEKPSAPIVLPAGQPAPPTGSAGSPTGTSTPPTPIVPAGG
jgi:hypothetical protein